MPRLPLIKTLNSMPKPMLQTKRLQTPFTLALMTCIAVIVAIANPAFSQENSDQYIRGAEAYQQNNFGDAEKIWTALVEAGDKNSQFALAVMHMKGVATQPELSKAFALFSQAAEQGHVSSMFNLGTAFWNGTGTTVDKDQAIKWWERAAEQGDAGAQYNLGHVYANFVGEPLDMEKAKLWTQKAVDAHYPEAAQLMNDLSNLGAQPQADTSPNSEANHLTTYWQTIDTPVALSAHRDRKSENVKTLAASTPVTLIETKQDRALVEVPGGFPVWIASQFIDDNGTVTGDSVNIRPIPSTKGSQATVIAKLNKGDATHIVNRQTKWTRIIPQQTLRAWVDSSQIRQYQTSEEARKKQWIEFEQ